MPSLTSIAEQILANAKTLDEHLATRNSISPSFDLDSLVNLSPELEPVRDELINSTHTLNKLAQGPVSATIGILYCWTDLVSLRAIYTYKLPQAVPIDGSATYREIASVSGISESMVRRFLRHAMTNNIFTESTADTVRHTAASRLMVTDPDFLDAIGLQTAELAPTSGRIFDALSKYGESGKPNETAFSLANSTNLGTYEYLSQTPERARRFGAAMRFFTKGEGWSVKHLVAGFDWASIDHPGATVVDLGGGQGGVSQVLAQATNYLTFIVQDLPGTIKQGKSALPKHFQGRIKFTDHDFFTEQTIERPPDIYLCRYIFHNWSDGYCVQILRNLIPSLGEDTRIIIYEFVLEDKPETMLTEKRGLIIDIVMATCYNGAERSKTQWMNLLTMADKRFVLRNVVKPEGSTMSILEVAWHPSE